VYLTLGTLFGSNSEVFRTALAGLAKEDIEVVVTVGANNDPAAIGHVPPNARVERFVPQADLLPRCTAVIHHGGSGTMYGSLANGLPQVVLPQGADNFVNAQRCAVAGVGTVVMPDDVGAARVRDAAVEALDCGIPTVVAVAEEVPFRDVVTVRTAARSAGGRFIGPNTNGILSPGEARVGFFSQEFATPGRVGMISRSGTLSYAVLTELKQRGLGVSTAVGIGGGLVRGTGATELMDLFEQDPATDLIVYLGEIGSGEEEAVAERVEAGYTKPVVALIVGRVGDPGQAMGHAGAVVYGETLSFEAKVRRLEAAGVAVARHLGEIAERVEERASAWQGAHDG